jgi:hypothetical protein
MKGPQRTVFCVFLSVVAFGIFCHVVVWMLLETMCKELCSGFKFLGLPTSKKLNVVTLRL